MKLWPARTIKAIINMKTFVEMVNDAALAKVKRAEEMGTTTSWTTEDHHQAAAEYIAQVVQDEVEVSAIRRAVDESYNHSGTAQRLERIGAAFFAAKKTKVAHFQRQKTGVKRGPEGLAAMMAALTQEVGQKSE